MTIVNPVVHTGGDWVPPRKVVIQSLRGKNNPQFIRYVLFRTPWGGVQIHKWLRPDEDRHTHNHPRAFWTFVLRGGYEEIVAPYLGLRWEVGSQHRVPLWRKHRVTKLLRVPTWTLVIVGPKRQDWGFFTEDGFILADDYAAWQMDREK